MAGGGILQRSAFFAVAPCALLACACAHGNHTVGVWPNPRLRIPHTIQPLCQGPEPAAGLVLHYEGEFRRGVREGLGTLHLRAAAPSETYVEHFSGGLPHGRGRRTSADGAVFDGEWVRGVRHGAGRLTTRGGDVFVGEFVSGKRQGLGALFLPGKGEMRLPCGGCGARWRCRVWRGDAADARRSWAVMAATRKGPALWDR